MALDEDAWLRFEVLFGDDVALHDIVRLFVNESSKMEAAVVAALAQDDPEPVRRAAHSLKSTSHHLGAMRLSDICRKLETDAGAGDVLACKALLPAFRAELGRVHEELGRRVPL